MRYRNIYCSIWNDDKFPFMSVEAKAVFFHLLTTPFSTPFGLYKAGLGALSEEMRMPIQRYTKPFREGLAKRLYRYNETVHVVYIPNVLKYNLPANNNVLIHWLNLLVEIPDCTEKDEFLYNFSVYLQQSKKNLVKPFSEWYTKRYGKRLPERYTKPVTVTVTVTEEKKKGTKEKKWVIQIPKILSPLLSKQVAQPLRT